VNPISLINQIRDKEGYMLLRWLRENLETMGNFFELTLSEPTLEVFTQLMERKLNKAYPIELIRRY
jgi:hypothetical protein